VHRSRFGQEVKARTRRRADHIAHDRRLREDRSADTEVTKAGVMDLIWSSRLIYRMQSNEEVP
jgi:hypothetical protein